MKARVLQCIIIFLLMAALVLPAGAVTQRSGEVVGWGSNAWGQCNVPSPNIGFVAIASGYSHSLGLKEDGSIVAWGDNYFGQCSVPSPNTGFVAIAAGHNHSLGLKADGSIVAWGDNYYGQCNVPSPNTGFVAISAGGGHSLGLKADGSIVGWGDNIFGVCNAPSPNTGFVAISTSYSHSLGLKADGSIVGWGYNGYGQCNVISPNHMVTSNSEFVAIAAGSGYSLGLKTDSSIYAWGNNTFGQCNVPSPNIGFVAIASGYDHSLGLKADGSIVAWGRYLCGNTNVPSPNTGSVAITAGGTHSLAIRATIPAPIEVDIDTAKKADEWTAVKVLNAIVTTAFYNVGGTQIGFAIEEPDRSSGIRVISGSSILPGDNVNIEGTAVTMDGERVIAASSVTVNSSGNETPAPFAIDNKDTGGDAYGAQAAVVDNATSDPIKMSKGVNNIGLLMTIRGKVGTYYCGDSYFYVDDGYGIHNEDYDFETGLKDGSGRIGIRCRPAYTGNGIFGARPAAGKYVEVTGVMGETKINGRNARYFWTSSWREAEFVDYTMNVYRGSDLISLPMQPKNPDPVEVFGGADYIDYRLIEFDQWHKGSIAYDMYDPANFGALSTSTGYWLNSAEPRTIQYQAYEDNGLDKWISLAPGNNIVGLPFTASSYWGSWKANDGTETKTLMEASGYGAGWLCSVGTWWDAERRSSRDLGLTEDYAFTEWMEPGRGFWIYANKTIALIAPAD